MYTTISQIYRATPLLRDVLKITIIASALALAGCADGSNGRNGAMGAMGAIGPSGLNGADGTNGTNGTNGSNGTNGNSPQPLSLLQPALSNAGKAVDQVLPLGLQKPLGDVGQALDGTIAPVGASVTQLAQQVGDALHAGAPANWLLTSLGGNLQQVGGNTESAVPGLNGVISNLGAAIANAGGIVHKTADSPAPLHSTLDSATKSVVALTSGLGLTGGNLNGDLLGGVPDGGNGGSGNLLGRLLGGQSSSPVGDLPAGNILSSVTGSLGNSQAVGALPPVTGLLGGLGGNK